MVLSIIVLALLTWVFLQRDHLHRLSRTDPLTELANRRHADGIMARSAAVSLRSDRPWAVAIIDIDRFKSVNDLLGHAKGDRVIRSAEQTTVARQGGSGCAARADLAMCSVAATVAFRAAGHKGPARIPQGLRCTLTI